MSFRKEEKIKIHKNQLLELLYWIEDNGGVELHHPRIVSSTYFDNDKMSMYQESEEGSLPRKKIRVRSYHKNEHVQQSCSMEIKTSSIEGRFKINSNDFDLKKIMRMGVLDADYGICKPVVRVTYQRSYYQIHNVRLTIDQNIEYAHQVLYVDDLCYKIRSNHQQLKLKLTQLAKGD